MKRSPSVSSEGSLEYGMIPDGPSTKKPKGGTGDVYSFRTLRLSGFEDTCNDNEIRDFLRLQFKRFGEPKITSSENSESIREYFVTFSSPEIASEAKSFRQNLTMFDKALLIEPLYDKIGDYFNSGGAKTNSTSNRPPPGNFGHERDFPFRNMGRFPYNAHGNQGFFNRGNRGNNHPYGGGFDGGFNRNNFHNNYGRGGYDNYRGSGYDFRGGGHPNFNAFRNRNNFNHFDNRNMGMNTNRRFDGAQNSSYNDDSLPPEDYCLATRNLFVGNLEESCTEELLRGLFSKFGVVEEIDLKRKGPGMTFAFMKFATLDMAYLAKCDMHGHLIGRNNIKVGYGKAVPTKVLWVGGLGPGIHPGQLEREFDRYGAINTIDYEQGDNQAYIIYESPDAAQAACLEMRGTKFGTKRIRVDYADEDPDKRYYNRSTMGYDRYLKDSLKQSRFGGGSGYQDFNAADVDSPRKSFTGRDYYNPEYSRTKAEPENSSRNNIESLSQLMRSARQIWTGDFVLKNSAFYSTLYHISGDLQYCYNFLSDRLKSLKITQRLRLEQSKIDEVKKRMELATNSNHGVLLCVGMDCRTTKPPTGTQSRPLKYLITYLKQKEAAGIISIDNGEGNSAVVHSFPPCLFGHECLLKYSPNLDYDPDGEDHMIIIVVPAEKS